MEQFINKYGTEIIISDNGSIYMKAFIDNELELELTFDSIEDAESKMNMSIEDISEEDFLNYQDEIEQDDFEEEQSS